MAPARRTIALRGLPVINNEKVRVQDDGSFSEFLAVAQGATAEIVLRATNRGGGVAELRRRATAAR